MISSLAKVQFPTVANLLGILESRPHRRNIAIQSTDRIVVAMKLILRNWRDAFRKERHWLNFFGRMMKNGTLQNGAGAFLVVESDITSL